MLHLHPLNRPQRLNALSDPLAAELACVLQGFDDDPGIAVIVVTGNEKAFAAGADIKAMAEATLVDMIKHSFVEYFDGIRRVKKPLIAAVSAMHWVEAASWRCPVI